MCILTFVTRYCERFPFILIGNRDEQLGRGTRHLRYDAATGLIWAVDQLAGGSWMGIEPRSGRFTILTNCRRAAAAPLTRPASSVNSGKTSSNINVKASSSFGEAADSSCAANAQGVQGRLESATRASKSVDARVEWRGAAPLSHIRQYTKAVPVRPELRTPSQPDARTLVYDPPSSRGTIIKNYLLAGALPAETAADSYPSPPHSPLTPPFYAGYNLLTCDTLRTASGSATDVPGAPSVCYTTNRYATQYKIPVAAGEVHVLQNSFLDNTAGEPISARLQALFTAALGEVIQPLARDPAATYSVTDVATRLADACLCDRSHFDIPQMMAAAEREKEGQDETCASSTAAASHVKAAALNATVHSTNPLLGFSAAELQEFFGDAADTPHPFTDGGAARIEAYLQANILKTPIGGHGTRVQSMVLVERVPVAGAGTPSFTDVIHFCQRDVSFEGEEQRCVGAPWISFCIHADGTFVREAEYERSDSDSSAASK